MKPAADSCASMDALLLDYAYGELEGAPRREVEQHLAGCLRCRTALMQVAETRHAMAALTPEPAPQAGLESLLTYAQQAADQRGASPKPSALWRWLVPAVSLAGVAAVGLVFVSRPHPESSLAPPSPVVVVVVVAQPPAPKSEPAVQAASAALEKKDEAGPMAGVRPDGNKAADRLEQNPENRPIATALPKSPAPTAEHAAKAMGLSHEGSAGFGGSSVPADKPNLAPPSKRSAPAKDRQEEDLALATRERDDLQPPPPAAAPTPVAPAAAKPAEPEPLPAPRPVAKGEATGSPGMTRAPMQTPVYGAASDSEAQRVQRRDEVQGVKEAALMSNMAMPSTAAASGGDDDARYAKAEKKKARKADAETAEELLARIAELKASGDLSGVEAAQRQFLARFPSHPRALEQARDRVAVLERLHRAPEAEAARAEIATRWPDSAEAALARGAGAAGPRAAPAAPARAPAAPAEMDKRALDADVDAAKADTKR